MLGGLGRWARVLVALLAAIPLVLANPPPADAQQRVAQAVDELVRDVMQDNAVPGIAVAVIRGGRILHLRGYGDDGNGDPVTPRTRFPLASLSKSFTAVAVQRLAEEGALDLDTPVRRYLPGFRTADAVRSGRITVRHLLNQTSGMADTGFPETAPPAARSIEQRVASLRAARLVSEPGTAYHYFNANYAVLARLVEVVGGRPFGDYLRARVLEPLGMSDTVSAVRTGEFGTAGRAVAQGHVIAFGFAASRDEPGGYVAGSGGVVSTARDMANYLRLHVGAGGPAATPVVSEAAIEAMHTPPPGVEGGYAMGWLAHGGDQPWLDHTGVLSTYYAEQAIIERSAVGVAVLTNAYHALSGTAGLAHRIAERVDGRDAGSGLSLRVIGYALLAAGVLLAGFRGRRLATTARWARRHRRPRGARSLLWVLWALWTVWMLVPLALLAALPALTTTFSGRVFGYEQLFWAMPDVVAFLGLAAVTGLGLVTARGLALVRGRAAGEPTGRSR